MCNCKIYQAYDYCYCPETKEAHAKAYLKMLQCGYKTIQAKLVRIEQHQLDKDKKNREKVSNLQLENISLTRHAEKIKQKLKEVEALKQDQNDAMIGSRAVLRELNQSFMAQIKMLRVENIHLKKLMAEGTSSSLSNTGIMSKTELKLLIASMELELKESYEELDNKERMINAATLANSVLRKQLAKR